MTEAQWLACADRNVMMAFLEPKVTFRKIRLVTCAWFRLNHILMASREIEEFVTQAERRADGLATTEDMQEAMRRAADVPHGDAVFGLLYLDALPRIGGRLFSSQLARDSGAEDALNCVTDRQCCDLVRCVFGHMRPVLGNRHAEWLTMSTGVTGIIVGHHERPNEFERGRPIPTVTADPNWLTSTVVALARQMYESRDFSAMPILADALQDAGCDSDDILDHCRDANQPHVRGCWVVDLVLGKE